VKFFDRKPVAPCVFSARLFSCVFRVCFFLTRREEHFSTVFLAVISTPLFFFVNFSLFFVLVFPVSARWRFFQRPKLKKTIPSFI